MITDVWFYLAAIPAVFFYGMGKGGVGGILGMLSVPLMAMTLSPIQAAAILLPLLCVMDLMALYYHRKHCDYRELKSIMPFAVIGIIIASYFIGAMREQVVELIIGSLALLFLIQKFLLGQAQQSTNVKGYMLSMLSGFSSMVAHAGGPPMSIYFLPKNFSKEKLIGTSVVFFALLNFIKLIPYTYMGQFSTKNLLTSCVLIPVAYAGVRTGVWLVNKISQELIYKISYVVLLITGCKMVISGLFS